MGKLQNLDIGESPEFVLGVFGEPSKREDCTDLEEKPGQFINFVTFKYILDHYSLQVFFYRKKIHSFTVILTDPTQKLKIDKLGNKTFGEVSFATFDVEDDAYDTPVIDKNPTAWGYVRITLCLRHRSYPSTVTRRVTIMGRKPSQARYGI
jgi:hypothetical protein